MGKIAYEEFDYQTLLDAVRHYSQPRQKISHLLAQGVIVRVKREELAKQIPAGRVLRIKLDVDTDPPLGFHTETRYLLKPVPFAIRCYTLPNLFAGKMHALLFRRWRNRFKGRDWYDFIWYAANHPELHLAHLEQRMRQTGHWKEDEPLTEASFKGMVADAIERLDVEQAKKDVYPFLRDPRVLDIWSADFFRAVASQLKIV